jgi:WD40 repeat protein
VDFSPDGRSLVTGGEDGRVRFFHMATRRELIDIATPFKQVRRLAIAPDGEEIALVGDHWEAAVISIPRRREEN